MFPFEWCISLHLYVIWECYRNCPFAGDIFFYYVLFLVVGELEALGLSSVETEVIQIMHHVLTSNQTNKIHFMISIHLEKKKSKPIKLAVNYLKSFSYTFLPYRLIISDFHSCFHRLLSVWITAACLRLPEECGFTERSTGLLKCVSHLYLLINALWKYYLESEES